LRRSSRLTVLWLTPKTLAIHSWLVPPLLSAPIWQRSSYVTRRYLLIGDLLLSQKVTPSSPHSLMHWLLESAESKEARNQGKKEKGRTLYRQFSGQPMRHADARGGPAVAGRAGPRSF